MCCIWLLIYRTEKEIINDQNDAIWQVSRYSAVDQLHKPRIFPGKYTSITDIVVINFFSQPKVHNNNNNATLEMYNKKCPLAITTIIQIKQISLNHQPGLPIPLACPAVHCIGCLY